ncbi:HTH_Tnp_Tc3_2 domain-containing protein [Trichonephila clavipes]|nr:HTH_Tnp_Tc3_2 domain-containing protein [Trichonephila clavipes]
MTDLRDSMLFPTHTGHVDNVEMEHPRRVTDWWHVIFSDDSFSVNADDQRIRVWRQPGHRSDTVFVVMRLTAITQGVTVWGEICRNTRSPLVVLQHTLKRDGPPDISPIDCVGALLERQLPICGERTLPIYQNNS